MDRSVAPYLIGQAARLIAKITETTLPYDNWYPWAHRAYRTGIDLIREHRFDLIWSTAPPLSGLHLAYRLGKVGRIPVVVDFRDVRRSSVARQTRAQKRFSRLEKQIVEGCAGITYAAPVQIDALHDQYPRSQSIRSRLIYNWIDDSEDFNSVPDTNCPTILYGGILYGGARRIDGFISALKRIQTECEYQKKPFLFRFLGFDSELSLLRSRVTAEGLEDVVSLEAAVPNSEFKRLCRQASVLLVVIGHNQGSIEHAGAIPAKVYEYFAAKRPILVIGPRDCEAGRIVERVRRGVFVPDDAPEAIAQALLRLLSNGASSQVVDLRDEAVRVFTKDYILPQIVTFFDDMIGGHEPSQK